MGRSDSTEYSTAAAYKHHGESASAYYSQYVTFWCVTQVGAAWCRRGAR